MKVTFPFEYVGSNKFGKIFRPYATISVFKKDLGLYIQRVMVVDSGADLTIFPKKDATIFGIDLEKETTKDKTFGIGGEEIIFLYKELKVKLGDLEISIPCGFINRNDIPALLGRQQFLELFKVIFEEHKTELQK